MIRPVEGPGENFVRPWAMVLIGLYLITGTILCIITLSQMWPHPTPSMEPDDKKEATTTASTDTTATVPATGTTATSGTTVVTETTATSTTTTKAAAAPTAGTSRQRQEIRRPTKEYLEARCGADTPGNRDCRQCENQAHLMREHLDVGENKNDPECLRVLQLDIVMWNERRLMLIVIFAGALGGLLYGTRSFFWYVGNRGLVQSWIPIYLFAPFTSALIGLVTYLIIRGGFFSGVSTIGDTSPYGFAAVAVLAGMHHRETAEKLRQIFEVVFTKAQAGKDTEHPKPRIKAVKSDQSPPLSRTNASKLTITGDGFIDESVVKLDGKIVGGKLVRVSDTELYVTVQPDEVRDLDDEIHLTVYNPAPGGGSSDAFVLKAELPAGNPPAGNNPSPVPNDPAEGDNRLTNGR